MNLPEGGHLTHGHHVNFSGKIYKSVSYGVDPVTHLLDYDAIELLAQQHRPKLIIAGASAYSRTIDFARFAAIARSVDALFLADIAHIAGLVVAGLHPTPVGHADFITSTTHKTLRGTRGGLILCTAQWAERIDKAVMPGIQGGPLMHAIAAKAVGFHEALHPSFALYQQQIVANAAALASEFAKCGYTIVANGTDNHLFVLDLQKHGLSGHEAQTALELAGISSSKSCIPNDPQRPWITSGIRFGTPAVTTRGMREAEMSRLAAWIDTIFTHHKDINLLAGIRSEIAAFARHFPIPEYHYQLPSEAARQPFTFL